jgi:hypothetical protein
MRNANFIPLSQLEESCWNVRLPEFVDADRIGLHAGRLGVLANIAGYKDHVHVSSADGDTTEYNPMIVGGDSQGNAYGAMGGVKSARLSNIEGYDDGHRGTLHTSPHLRITLNTAEMTQRLQHTKANVRAPEAWAAQLNDSIGDGLREAAREHMLGHPKYPELLNAAIAGTLLAVQVSPESSIAAPGVLATWVLMYNAMKGMSSVIADAPLREVCWSAVPAVHPDRVLAVSALTRMRKLVKVLPSS